MFFWMLDAQMFLQLQPVPRTEHTFMFYILNCCIYVNEYLSENTACRKSDNRRDQYFITMATGVWLAHSHKISYVR